jgi:hypothetical protein
VLTNLEMFEHLKELQVEIDQVSECRRFNISRQIWRQQGKKGVNHDVPTYDEDIEGEMYRLQRQREKLVNDQVKAREDKMRVKQEELDKVNGELLRKWEEDIKQANANRKRGQKKTTLPKPALRELSPEPESTASTIDTSDQPQTTEEAVEEARKSVLSKEQFYAVRPMTDALRFVTSSVSFAESATEVVESLISRTRLSLHWTSDSEISRRSKLHGHISTNARAGQGLDARSDSLQFDKGRDAADRKLSSPQYRRAMAGEYYCANPLDRMKTYD